MKIARECSGSVAIVYSRFTIEGRSASDYHQHVLSNSGETEILLIDNTQLICEISQVSQVGLVSIVNWILVQWILVLMEENPARVGENLPINSSLVQDLFHPPSHCMMPFHPHDSKYVFITRLEPKPQRSSGRLLRALRARALPPHGLTTLRPPSAARGCKGLPKQFIQEIMARN